MRWLLMVVLVSVSWGSLAGKIVVRKSSDPEFDVWAMKQELIQQNAWNEALRQQQVLNWVYSIPPGCLAHAAPYRYYACNNQYWRPYTHQGQNMYIQIDPPTVPPTQPKDKPKVEHH
ncbi:hypothetical protein K0504_08560 [Neiella marina]|uniref:Uncharacterized protein n=1 Tax=Neiella holothuriorum TaxID=2870530 RepID=A0ABS7EFI6_9GAMM|nr:hypothetical protein [Neiella holothuriorum]MBW8191083.1 hypothetical protein [Neiella holothuriorum]